MSLPYFCAKCERIAKMIAFSPVWKSITFVLYNADMKNHLFWRITMSRIFKPRTLVFALVLVVLAALTFGFAAQNTVADTKAGFGEGAVSGYSVAVSWDINDSNPSNATQATLDFGTDSPSEVWALVGTDNSSPYCDTTDWSGTWIDCTEGGTTATCAYTGSVLEICGIRVSAGE